ncbi:glutamate mutase L [Janibacter sp. G56]|uniref:glutamate mutase L n=1 Tax=Janibacter sp. G56 TaxID=3418717 RepID=UPI003D0371B5
MSRVLCVDVGSTWTKAALVDTDSGALLGTASTPTTSPSAAHPGGDVLHGVDALAAQLGVGQGVGNATGEQVEVRLCSSAGGGLRLAVVGHERLVTAEAGRRVGLGAGAKVVHVAAGELDGEGLRALRAAKPDVVLLVGGTDGGNAEVLTHNAARLAAARWATPIVVAGNAEAAPVVSDLLAATGRRFVVTDNVVPRIGVIAPTGARAAIRETFLRHVIGGKGLSRGPRFAGLVRSATPDAVLRGVEMLAVAADADVLVVDVGGATTDVYSVVTPRGEDATLAKEVVAPLWHARTVEADLGMRWSAPTVLEAAEREHLAVPAGLADHVDAVARDVSHRAEAAGEWRLETALAATAATIAVRRHGRPGTPTEDARPLLDVALLVGSGGVLRHAPGAVDGVLGPLLRDHGGGWRVPRAARALVDEDYVLFAAGILADTHAAAARALAATLLH